MYIYIYIEGIKGTSFPNSLVKPSEDLQGSEAPIHTKTLDPKISYFRAKGLGFKV